MKNKLIGALLILFSGLKLFGQNYYGISFEGNGLWENDFRHKLFIDTISNPNNIWQIGQPQKVLFSSAATPPNAIVTDSLNYYPINDTSSFILKHVANMGFAMPCVVTFGGSYFVNSDTLTDFGKIEFSPDNGSNWIDLADPLYASSIYWNDPFLQPPIFSGNSNGWKSYEADIQNLGPLFNIQFNDTVLFRFTFISDGIQTNKDGLMFDSLYVWDVPPIGIKNVNSNDINFFINPNPASTYIEVDINKSRTEIHSIEIYNRMGGIMKKIMNPLNEDKIYIDVSDFPEGIYLFSLINREGYKLFSKKFIKVK
jgi:hypothetical protein